MLLDHQALLWKSAKTKYTYYDYMTLKSTKNIHTITLPSPSKLKQQLQIFKILHNLDVLINYGNKLSPS